MLSIQGTEEITRSRLELEMAESTVGCIASKSAVLPITPSGYVVSGIVPESTMLLPDIRLLL